jgi:hypothetical protein
MAHFAQLNNNTVTQIVVISNADLLDENGVEQETLGIQVCRNIFGPDTNWAQTSYNGNFRKKYAGIGDAYSPDANVFYNPNPPYPSWTLDANYDWQPPVPHPQDEKEYKWDESVLQWVEVFNQEPQE